MSVERGDAQLALIVELLKQGWQSVRRQVPSRQLMGRLVRRCPLRGGHEHSQAGDGNQQPADQGGRLPQTAGSTILSARPARPHLLVRAGARWARHVERGCGLNHRSPKACRFAEGAAEGIFGLRGGSGVILQA